MPSFLPVSAALTGPENVPAEPPATTLVILGASGDLTRRLLFPALHRLIAMSKVDRDLRIVGYAIEDWTTDMFVTHLRQGVEELGGGVDEAAWSAIAANTTYVSGDLDPARIVALRERCGGNVIFYLALPPSLFPQAAASLATVGLADETDGFRRLVIEKPFGTSASSSDALQAGLLLHWQEHQLYRIDHFLGKDTVLNLLVFRLANRFVEAVWNSANIAQVQITAAETLGLEGRWRYYDQAGALRDMLQNHLMQLFALCSMEPPALWGGEIFRNHKVESLASVRSIATGEVNTRSVRGQYTRSADGSVVGYLEEPNISESSTTETYAALRLDIDTWRWQGVPFYLRSGKRLGGALTEIALQLRPPPKAFFAAGSTEPVEPMWIIFQLRPDETITIEATAKHAGLGLSTERIALRATDVDATASTDYSSYEQLILDALSGDPSHFIRGDEAREAWRIVQPVLDVWAAGGSPTRYVAGTIGPDAPPGFFDEGHDWRSVTV